MKSQLKKISLVASLALMSLSQTYPCFADTLQGGVTKTKVNSEQTYLQKHPVVKRTAIGAGVGAGAGLVTGLVTGKGAMRGAVIGASSGVGVGLIKSSKTMKQHPLATKIAEGTAIGLGLGLAGSRGHGAGRKVAAATGIGAAAGLGLGLLKDEFK